MVRGFLFYLFVWILIGAILLYLKPLSRSERHRLLLNISFAFGAAAVAFGVLAVITYIF